MNLSYRDEMPPVPEKKKIQLFSLTPKTLMFVGIGVGVVILGILLLVWSNSGNISPQLQRLSARLDTMQTIASDSDRSIRNNDLRRLNSDLRILTTGSIVKLREPMTAAGMGSVSGDIRAAEADTATIERLETAKTGGDFDGVYARIVEQKINTITVLMMEIYDNTRNANLREALSETYTDFATVREQLVNDIDF